MARVIHQDERRQEAAQAGLPPDVHDPALLASYAALGGGQPAGSERTAKAKKK